MREDGGWRTEDGGRMTEENDKVRGSHGDASR